MSDRPCLHLTTHRITPCSFPDCLLCHGYRNDTELSNVIPLREGLPKVNYSSKTYRSNSGAWIGQAPRTTEARWPSPPRAIEPGWFVRLVRRIFGR